MTTKPTSTGTNRTGAATSPIDSARTIEAAETATPFPGIDGEAIAGERLAWASVAEPVGTMPPPASIKGLAKAGIELIKGHHPNVLLDKLGERAAYERAGTRLWEAFLVKLEAGSPHAGGPTVEEVEHIRNDELRHYAIVRDAILALGGDPTAMTPCADISGVMGSGLVQVLTDPRTTVTQCLDAMLVAELTDNDAWMMLADLAESLGHTEMADSFRVALREEQEHLTRVRGWIGLALRGQAGIEPTPPQPEAAR
jgi:bacterioferritin (cytochrome b1)